MASGAPTTSSAVAMPRAAVSDRTMISMTSSESRAPKSVSEARAAGWKRCFIADEPRLSDAVEAYEEMGLEVALVPVELDGPECTECMKQQPERYRVIYTRHPDKS